MNKVVFNSEAVATQMSCCQTKGNILVTAVWAPHCAELILTDSTNNRALSLQDPGGGLKSPNNNKMFSLGLRDLDL